MGTGWCSEISDLLMEVFSFVFDYSVKSDNSRSVDRYKHISVNFTEHPSDFIDEVISNLQGNSFEFLFQIYKEEEIAWYKIRVVKWIGNLLA
jgi:hypothetical protein